VSEPLRHEVDAALQMLATAIRLTADDVYTLRLTLTKVADHLGKADTARVLTKGKSADYAAAIATKKPATRRAKVN
jgi:hypothetical protein